MCLDKLGRICLDILKGEFTLFLANLSCRANYDLRTTLFCLAEKWSPALQIRTVLLSVQALLSAPNPDDPLAADVAKHYKVRK